MSTSPSYPPHSKTTSRFQKPAKLARTRMSAGILVGFALLSSNARSQVSVAWSEPTRGESIAVDPQDNVFTADFEVQPGAEIVVTKRDVDGNLLWTTSFDQTDTTKWERAQWVAVDSQGDVIVCGTLMSGFSSPVVAASILCKFDSSGTPLWHIVFDGPFDGTSTIKLLVDASDDIYVLGTGIGATSITTRIKKFAPNGAVLWTYLDTAGIGAPTNFKFAGDGNLVVAGRSIFGSVNGFAKVDRFNGDALWSLTGVSSLTTGDVAGDALGNTYVVHGEFVIGGGTIVRKLGPLGAEIWSRTFASIGLRVEVGGDGLPVVSGFPNSGFGAAFFKVDASGALVWSNPDADGPLTLLLHAQMVLDETGNAYLAAGLLGSMAVCKVNSDGTPAWTIAVPGGSGARGLALGKATSSVFLVGGETVRLLDPQAIGAPYCDPAVSNSTGLQGKCSASGSLIAARNEVTLIASDLPIHQFGFFLTSQTQSFVANPGGSQGNLCLGGTLGRYSGVSQIRNTGATGTISLVLDLTQTPAGPASVAIQAGETWNFQAWHRDTSPLGLPGSNFTNGVTILFN